jgi:SPX domain protein involved in polyphosphate accumulation
LKKHAKWCRLSPNTLSSLSSQFIPHLETQHPFHRRVNYQHILRQLSSLYNARQDPENPENAVSSTTDDENLDESSLQSSVTYWVHSDNQVETELFLLKHLTLQVPTFPVSSGAIQRSTRAAYLDSYKWEGYENSVPVRNLSSNGRGRVPYIVWEENSRNKDVLMVIPEENISVPMKRKNVNKFLSSTEEVDLSLPEWTFSMDGGRWTKSAQKVHEYIHTSSLHPGTFPLDTY